MAKAKIEVNEEEEKWKKLQHYKCTICKEEFYFIKKDEEKNIKDDEFAVEPFLTLPIFKDEGKCPFCKASMKRLLLILSDEEKKEKKKKEEEEKKAEKEKLREELEKLKEEEARLDKLKQDQLSAMCDEIIDDTFNHLDDLERSLRKGDITIDRFETLFLNGAFEIMQKDSELYNRRNKEVALVLSNSFKTGFREAILDFNASVRQSLKTIEQKIESKNKEIEDESKEQNNDEKINSLNKEKEDLEDKSKDDFKNDLKVQDESLGDDFKRNLRKELR